jgi:uncharacterized protein (TIGR02677 family)
VDAFRKHFVTELDSNGPVPHAAGGRLTLFSYTVESLAPLYRAILRHFLEAKSRYQIQFRPDEIASELRRSFGELPEGGVDRALDRLVEWGNLRRSHDTGRVATLEDFRRRHFLYQLTPAGEVAERAVGEVIEALERSGSLQRVMLGSILRNLGAILQELESGEPRPDRLFEHLFNLTEQFKALTENASTFLARLHEAIDQGEVHAEAFIVYKQAVLEYLEQFLGELSETAPRITQAIRAVEAQGIDRLAALAAQADAAPAPLGMRDPAEELRRKWRGIAAWFVGDGREAAAVATIELLRKAARGAINRILLVLERLHEKRFRRFSRTTDLLRLAGWFDRLADEPGGEEKAHRLFQAIFGLFGARHLGGLEEDPDLVLPGASWWDAPPVPVAPALRETGRNTTLGRPARIVDHSTVKRLLAERHRREREARSAALARFAGHGPIPLSSLPVLSPDEFDLLLSLLDRLLAMPPIRLGPAGTREARSRDGRLRLRLEEPEPGRLATVETAAGRLTLPAYVLTVEDALAAPALREASA